MTDVVPPQVRSRMMAAVKCKNTKPEMVIRSGLHALGFRYKLHDSRLPGKPDLVLPKYRGVILVNGCFWHMHECQLFKLPSTRKEFWREKLERNRQRDLRNIDRLLASGWRVMVVWECALKGPRRGAKDTILGECVHWLLSDVEFASLEGR
ncbi:very short patch repair endonuclease [Marinobacter excellens]|jgi:DNA mismatch endonuclease (patch repair protein)|uniref:very short patch repair endonuclease n=1 Tax=Marinobacter excellens TaxID=218670 RepID=UPI0009EB9D11|nr:very short patch repair endonuclease [Marinobacter excellens]